MTGRNEIQFVEEEKDLAGEYGETLIAAIFGSPEPVVENGSDGITDDEFGWYGAEDEFEGMKAADIAAFRNFENMGWRMTTRTEAEEEDFEEWAAEMDCGSDPWEIEPEAEVEDVMSITPPMWM